MLASRGGSELVALWAQMSSVIELVSAVALAGIGTGLTVVVGQASHPEQERWLLRESIKLGLAFSLPIVLVVALLCSVFAERLATTGLSAGLVLLAASTGWIAVVPGMIGNYWLGRQRRDLVLWLTAASGLLMCAAAIGAPLGYLLPVLALAYAAPAVVVAFVMRRPHVVAGASSEWHPSRRALVRYAFAGVVIGVLSPASMLAARSIVSEAMSWQDAGRLQALMRVSDWVGGVAAGMLSLYFLPRFAARYGGPGFAQEFKRAAWMTIVPAAGALAILFALRQPIIDLLYDPEFRLSDAAVALFLAGTLARVASWVPLFALYAMRRTMAITLGELLSLPLFAVLLCLFAKGLTLESASLMWLVSFVAYGAFNLWAATRPARD